MPSDRSTASSPRRRRSTLAEMWARAPTARASENPANRNGSGRTLRRFCWSEADECGALVDPAAEAGDGHTT
jgi:hypothetical protein